MPPDARPRGFALERHTVRVIGWLLAANATGLLLALTMGGTVRDTAQRLALLCGIG